MAKDETATKVFEIIANSFGVDASSISTATTVSDVDGWDSLAHATLLLRLQRIFGVRLDPAAANAAQNVGALVALIEKRLKGHDA